MNGKRKLIITAVLALMLVVIAGVGIYYWYENTYYVSTEDARVSGDIVKVAPQITGKLLEFNVEEGQSVVRGQILGRQEMLNLPDTSLEMALLRSPINGVVLKKQANTGEIVSPGQALAALVDDQNLYISANIDETKVERVKVGETVDVTVDVYPDREFTGTVTSVGRAANSAFSVLPTSSGGNFTKVVQKVPVKIKIDYKDVQLAPGTNAVVKIHVK